MQKELISLRIKNQLTIKKMSEKLGVSMSLYSKVEAGIRTPSYEFLKKFKLAFPEEIVDEYFFK